VDLAGFVGSLTLADGALVVLFALAFIMGYSQGMLQQLLELGAFIAAFVLAANLRTPVGAWLSAYWTNVPGEFSFMIAFLTSFIILLGVATLAILVYYKRIELSSRYIVADEIAGGVLAMLVVMLIVGTVVLATDGYYGGIGRHPGGADVGWLRSLHDILDGAALVHFLRGNLLPGLLTVLGPLLPEAVRSITP
jgi:uncharacterized membrane protein required for colicin V production